MGRWSLLLGLVLLAGCASPAKPTPMPKEDYAKHAGVFYGLNQCIEQGYMTPETGALGLRYAQSDANRFWHSPLALNNAVKDHEKAGVSVSRSNCNQTAAVIADRKQQIDIHNASVDQGRQELHSTLNQINSNRPVICNTIGTYTMCQ